MGRGCCKNAEGVLGGVENVSMSRGEVAVIGVEYMFVFVVEYFSWHFYIMGGCQLRGMSLLATVKIRTEELIAKRSNWPEI